MKTFLSRVLLSLALLLPMPALAQTPPATIGAAVLNGWATLSVTNASGHVQLPVVNPASDALTIYNSGSKAAFFEQGVSATLATTSSAPIEPGTAITVWLKPGNTYFAAITGGSDTTTLVIYQGNGPAFLQLSGGAGGAPVTVNQGTSPWIVGITQWGSGTLGAMANYGTSPGAVLVPGVNAFVTNTPNVVPIASAASAAGVAPVPCSALCANQVIKGSAGNLYSFQVAADSTLYAAPWWIMIYDATSAPTDGAVTPKKCYAMPASSYGLTQTFPTPLSFATGITVGVSTTGCLTKTASTHAFISGDAQ